MGSPRATEHLVGVSGTDAVFARYRLKPKENPMFRTASVLAALMFSTAASAYDFSFAVNEDEPFTEMSQLCFDRSGEIVAVGSTRRDARDAAYDLLDAILDNTPDSDGDIDPRAEWNGFAFEVTGWYSWIECRSTDNV